MNYLSKHDFFFSGLILFFVLSLFGNEQNLSELTCSDEQNDQQREQQIIFEIDGVNSAINNPCRDDEQSDLNADEQDFSDEPEEQDEDQYGDEQEDDQVDGENYPDDIDQVELVPDPVMGASSLNQELSQENNLSLANQENKDEADVSLEPLQQTIPAYVPPKPVDGEYKQITIKEPDSSDTFVSNELQEKTVNTHHDVDLMDYIESIVVKIKDSIKALF